MPFQILSLSGGGYLGYYSLSVLAGLERRAGRPLAACFDLLAGTSVGGLIALGLAAGVPAEEIRRAFAVHGERIFPNGTLPMGRVARFLTLRRAAFHARYDPAALRAAVAELLGADTRLSALSRRVVVPAVDVSDGSPRLFRHHEAADGDGAVLAAEVAVAASAAPVFFPVAEVAGRPFMDGGIYAVAPDLLALDEAEHALGRAPGDIRLLSIGTATARFPLPPEAGRDLGIVQWAAGQRLVYTMMAAQQGNVARLAAHRLGERYLRLDAEPGAEARRHIGLDVATEKAREVLEGLAAETLGAHRDHPLLGAMLAHEGTAPPHGP